MAGDAAREGPELGDLLPRLRGPVIEKIDCMPAAVIKARCCPDKSSVPSVRHLVIAGP
jgi:hypothetical protein